MHKSSGQVVEPVYSFALQMLEPDELFKGKDGFFYGTISGITMPSAHFFKMTPDGKLTILHSTTNLINHVIQAHDGNFYAVTEMGGAFKAGSIYKISPEGQGATIHSFDRLNGSTVYSGLTEGPDGNLYGVTHNGGDTWVDLSKHYGTAFRMTPQGDFTRLVSFNLTNGCYPSAPLILGNDGNFYGSTSDGGTNNPKQGTLFKMTTEGALTTLITFGGTNGGGPRSPLIKSRDGNFYGSSHNSTGYGGNIFKLTSDGILTTLYSWDFGAQMDITGAMVEGSDGSLYGTIGENSNRNSPLRYGGIFRLKLDGTFAVIHYFDDKQGAGPYSGLTAGDDGNFFGTTLGDVISHSPGNIFKIGPGDQFTEIVSFTAGLEGVPGTGLTQAKDGALYGVTHRSRVPGPLLVYSITPSTPSAGINPMILPVSASIRSELLQGSNNLFYGTTALGGINDKGTIFQITSVSNVTTLVSFTGTNGSTPSAGLIQATDGLLYGTTYSGGANDKGTLFKMTLNGALTTLASFDGNGANPWGEMLQAKDGNFYGTTSAGGASGVGTVFKLTPAGTLTILASFNNSNGSTPKTRLIEGIDGNLYGACSAGGDNAKGTLFKVTPGGTVTVLRSFAGTDGASPVSGLLLAADGNFYGTTGLGGANGQGTFYRMTTGGNFTLIKSLDSDSGNAPVGNLVQAANGSIYMATARGGVFGSGTILRYGAPSLQIARSSLELMVQWQDSSPAYRLETSQGANGIWNPWNVSPTLSGTTNSVMFPANNPPQFFRLKQATE